MRYSFMAEAGCRTTPAVAGIGSGTGAATGDSRGRGWAYRLRSPGARRRACTGPLRGCLEAGVTSGTWGLCVDNIGQPIRTTGATRTCLQVIAPMVHAMILVLSRHMVHTSALVLAQDWFNAKSMVPAWCLVHTPIVALSAGVVHVRQCGRGHCSATMLKAVYR
jgi:hypothetical protein